MESSVTCGTCQSVNTRSEPFVDLQTQLDDLRACEGGMGAIVRIRIAQKKRLHTRCAAPSSDSAAHELTIKTALSSVLGTLWRPPASMVTGIGAGECRYHRLCEILNLAVVFPSGVLL